MLEKLKKALADDNELDNETLRFLSLIFLLISGIMSFLVYTQIIDWWPDAKLTFRPGLISTVIN